MAIKLIAFDFDGTLVHTAPDIITATNEFLQLHGRKTLSDQEILEHIGMGLIALIRGVVPEAEHHEKLAIAVEEQFSRIYDLHVLKNPQPFDGVREFLDSWPHKIAIVSNKPEKYIHQILKHLEMDSYPWSSIIGGDTFVEKKPHPLPLENAMRAAGVSPNETLMVGDGPPDVGVAVSCGVAMLAVTFGYSTIAELRSLGAKHSLEHFEHLHSFIRQFENFGP